MRVPLQYLVDLLKFQALRKPGILIGGINNTGTTKSKYWKRLLLLSQLLRRAHSYRVEYLLRLRGRLGHDYHRREG